MADDDTNVTEEIVDDAQVMPDAPVEESTEPELDTKDKVVDQDETEEQTEEVLEEETPEVPEEKPPSRREQLRIQQLLQKYGDPRRKEPSQPPVNPLDYSQELSADPEVIRQLELDRQRVAQAQYGAGVEAARAEIRTSEWRATLKFEAPQVESKYGWLNPKDQENFDPAMASAVNQEYMSLVGFNEQTGLVERPDISYADFVDARVELSNRLAKAMTADTAKNIAKQSAQTGLRPDGSSAKRMNLNQAPEDMTIEELYAKIGQRPPKK